MRRALSLLGVMLCFQTMAETMIVHRSNRVNLVYNTVDVDSVTFPDSESTFTPAGMAFIPAKDSSFLMGGGQHDANFAKPRHSVTLTRDFWMDSTEVTQAEYSSLMRSTYANYTEDPIWRDTSKGDDYPAYYVTWFEAVLYCNARTKRDGLDTVYVYDSIVGSPSFCNGLTQLVQNLYSGGYRLPTEAEWEYACRAGTTGRYFWDGAPVDHFAWYGDNSGGWDATVKRVGLLLPNGYGLLDIIGNVSEMCGDWFALYSEESLVDPSGPDSSESEWGTKVSRGGEVGLGMEGLPSAWRGDFGPTGRSRFTGFRVVLPAIR